MKTSIVSFFLAFSVVLAPTAALAASNPAPATHRYFVQTTKSFWRNAFSARNTFAEGFTADLSDLQLRLAKFAGLKPLEVKVFNNLDQVAVVASISPTPTPQSTPATTIPWGVAYIHDASKAATGEGIQVAILDTGIDVEHTDLKERITVCADYADSAKAFIDGQCADTNGHGTHMAGIIAASGGTDGKGILGVAPKADIMIYKVCSSDGVCLSDDIAKGIQAAVDAGANIIVLGLGGEAASSFVDDALAYAAAHDVLLVAAAGNDGPYDDSLDWPARNPLTVSVGAIDSDGAIAEFSSRGTNAQTKSYEAESGDIELVAPGLNIESTFKGGGYAILSGTSAAAAHVAGLAALVWQGDKEHPAQATRSLLHTIATDVGAVGDDSASGWGVPVY